jgi:polar amino acid transport system substrate-binding protein
MLTRRHFLIGSAAATAGLSTHSRAGEPGRIVVAYHDQPDELWRLSPTGATIGIAREILEEVVARRAGYPLDYLGLPWLRAQDAVRDGSADALFTIPSPERRRYIRFTPLPLVRYPLAIAYLKEGPHAAALDQLDGIEALKRFAYVYNQFDTDQSERARAFPTTVGSPGDAPMLREVAGGRGDFTIVNPIRVHRVLVALGLVDLLKVRPLPALGRIEHYFGLRESYPDTPGVIDRIASASRAATSDGSIQAILDQHVTI